MTTTDLVITNSPERQARISGYWARHRDWSFDQVAELVDAELRDEAETAALQAERGRAFSASLDSLWSCPVCGQTAMNTGLCPDCQRMEAAIRVERSASLPIPGGGDRKAAVEAWMERLGR